MMQTHLLEVAQTRLQALAITLPLMVLTATPAVAGVITVDDQCTFIDAVVAANGDLAVGSCPAGSGADQLVLTRDVSLRAAVGPELGTPEITSEIAIDGAGFRIERTDDGTTPAFRLLTVASTGTLTLRDVVVTGGLASLGGGISNDGVLNLEHSSVVDNEATSVGGGIFNRGSLTVIRSRISDNRVNLEGGGIYNTGPASISASTLAGNATTSDFSGIGGGAIFNTATLDISDSTINGNSGASGGGIHNGFRASLTLTNVTISGNHDFGIRVGAAGGGGIINNGELTAEHVTIVKNRAHTDGGGIFTRRSVTLTNSIIAFNTSDVGSRPNCTITSGAFVLRGANFSDDALCRFFLPLSEGLDLDPSLADNGGRTLSHALPPGSVAVDATSTCTTQSDQRGGPRGALCDAGAFELDDCVLAVDPVAEFGAVVAGQSRDVDVELRNTGSTSCNVFELAVIGDEFALASPPPIQPLLVAAGGSSDLSLSFTPTGAGVVNGQLSVLSFEEPELLVTLLGTGLADPVNDLVQPDDVETAYDPTSSAAPAGVFTIRATFTNVSTTRIPNPVFVVSALSGGNQLLNADGGPGGVGATLRPDVGDQFFDPGESFVIEFQIGLQDREPFEFFVDLFGS